MVGSFAFTLLCLSIVPFKEEAQVVHIDRLHINHYYTHSGNEETPMLVMDQFLIEYINPATNDFESVAYLLFGDRDIFSIIKETEHYKNWLKTEKKKDPTLLYVPPIKIKNMEMPNLETGTWNYTNGYTAKNYIIKYPIHIETHTLYDPDKKEYECDCMPFGDEGGPPAKGSIHLNTYLTSRFKLEKSIIVKPIW